MRYHFKIASNSCLEISYGDQVISSFTWKWRSLEPVQIPTNSPEDTLSVRCNGQGHYWIYRNGVEAGKIEYDWSSKTTIHLTDDNGVPFTLLFHEKGFNPRYEVYVNEDSHLLTIHRAFLQWDESYHEITIHNETLCTFPMDGLIGLLIYCKYSFPYNLDPCWVRLS